MAEEQIKSAYTCEASETEPLTDGNSGKWTEAHFACGHFPELADVMPLAELFQK